ncbi:MAG: hypothetical protein R3251_00465 [Candidatus Spechtbacterales bacterium]|nr:hypothetical protein [Candidatus Spechtbacterales bacterium]
MKKFLIFFTILLFASTSSVNAEEVGLAATQNLFDIEIFSGNSYEGEITVFNQSDNLALPVGVKLNLWNLSENTDDIEFIQAEEALNATKWFSFEEGTEFLLTEKDTSEEAKTIPFTINVPQDTPPGSYFVMMRFEAIIPPHYFEETGPRTIPEVGVLFFIRVVDLSLEGERINYSAQIVALEPKDKDPLPLTASLIPLPRAEAGVFEDMVREITASVQNDGIYHFTTEGFIEVKNMFGTKIATADLPKKIMMPGRVRSFDVEILAEESFWQRNFRLGPYSATMLLTVPEHKQPIVRTMTFWTFPWKALALVVIMLLLITEFRNRIFKAIKVLTSKQYE